MSNQNYNQLSAFLGAYFHQDWGIDNQDYETVVRRYIADNSRERLTAVLVEIEELLTDIRFCDDPVKMLTKLGCDYNTSYSSQTPAEWVRAVATIIESSLQDSLLGDHG